MSATRQAPAAMAPAVTYVITDRSNGWITAVGSDGRTIRVSVGGNGR